MVNTHILVIKRSVLILVKKGNGGVPVKISDFQTKDVINIVDGKKLGQISDLELDLRQGRIESIVVPNMSRFFGLLGGGTELIIPWKNIIKIGLDVVLVKLDESRPYRNEDSDIVHDYSRSYKA
jgi:YlmC/YmxH family sporulation protein